MNHPRSASFATFAVFAILAAAPSTQGAFLTGAITGQVTSTGGSVPGIVVGSLVTGSYAYDDSTTFAGILGATNPLTAFSLTIGTNPQTFSLTDLSTGGSTSPGVVPGHSTPTVKDLFFIINFSALNSFVGAAVGQQTISAFPPQSFSVSSDAAHSFSFSFSAAVGTAAVPEPSTLTLLGIGCGAMAGFGWRARHRSRA